MNDPTHLVCTHCSAVNRLKPERLNDNPKCGKCHRPLFIGKPFELNAAALGVHIQNDGVPLLVDFWAPWCGPCKIMAPQFEQAARTLEPRLRLAKVNTESEPGLGQQYGIRSIPTLVLFHRGRELARQPGAMGSQDIVNWARQRL